MPGISSILGGSNSGSDPLAQIEQTLQQILGVLENGQGSSGSSSKGSGSDSSGFGDLGKVIQTVAPIAMACLL